MDTQPDTHEVDQSEIRTQILLATASSVLKGRQSFTHMLTEVRPDDNWFLFVSTTVLQEICEILEELYLSLDYFQPTSRHLFVSASLIPKCC